jgi:hypothetical protein
MARDKPGLDVHHIAEETCNSADFECAEDFGGSFGNTLPVRPLLHGECPDWITQEVRREQFKKYSKGRSGRLVVEYCCFEKPNLRVLWPLRFPGS